MIEYLTIAVPKNVVDRSHLDPVALENFERVTGIKKTRRYEGTTSQMIIDAMNKCDFYGDDVECVIVVTQSPDRLSPCMAMDVHHHLRLNKSIPAFDINHACDGYIMGLWLAQRTGRKTLLICADRLRYNKTPIEGLIFSDSVSITVVTPVDTMPVNFLTDGEFADKLYCGFTGDMAMDGPSVFDFVTTRIPSFINEFTRLWPSQLLVPHQANASMNRVVELRSGYKDNTLNSIQEYGNQSMNSIPTAIMHNEERALGQNLCLVGFGAGYSAAIARIRWPSKPVTFKVEI